MTRPVVYRYLSHGRFRGRTLLQLNYVVWFPARSRTGPPDILAGRLDGITRRLTPSGDGRPLLYDTMHNCGCYHMFFTTSRLRLPHARGGHEEPLPVPRHLPDPHAHLVLRIAHRTQYVYRLYFEADGGGSRQVDIRRYFDDPHLIERYFAPAQGP